MIFEADAFYIDVVEATDLNAVLEVYHSNKDFLLHHMGRDTVTYEWLQNEYNAMKTSDFCPCKVVEKGSGSIIGIADFRIGCETYLSLLMLHSDYQHRGLGKHFYQAIEEYARSHSGACIRIDVATDYDNSVFQFWSSRGFSKVQYVTLNWTGKRFPAVMMKKIL